MQPAVNHEKMQWSKQTVDVNQVRKMQFNLFFALQPSACTHCSPSGKPSGLQACTLTVEAAKREKIPTNKERGEILGIGGLCKKYKILLSLQSRQGVT